MPRSFLVKKLMELDDVTSQGQTKETHDVTTEHDSGCEGSDLEEIGKNLP